MVTLDPVFKPLEQLLGSWTSTGRTLDASEDNISAEVTIEPILGGAYIQLSGYMNFKDGGHILPSVEIIGYNPVKNVFPSYVFSNMEGRAGSAPVSYEWRVEDDGTIIHQGGGAIYHGVFKEGGTVLDGGWRPENGVDDRDEATYDLRMTRRT